MVLEGPNVGETWVIGLDLPRVCALASSAWRGRILVADFLLLEGDFDIGVVVLFGSWLLLLPALVTLVQARQALAIVKLLGEVDVAQLA